jgi:hypothetical protein
VGVLWGWGCCGARVAGAVGGWPARVRGTTVLEGRAGRERERKGKGGG